jgi:hypothetical protein
MATLKSKVGAVIIPKLPLSRRALEIMRHELRSWTTRFQNAVDPNYHLTLRKLRASKHLSLNLGSGGKGLPGWVNIELTRHQDTTICLDIRRKLPFASESAVRVLAEHIIEHIDFVDDLPLVLSELHRVLEPGGVLRIIVPDAERYLDGTSSGGI